MRYDFPSKDLARVLYLLMRKENGWNKLTFHRILHAYLKDNPLSAQHQLILYADLAFPHIVERFLRKQVYQRMTHAQVLSFLQRERKKNRLPAARNKGPPVGRLHLVPPVAGVLQKSA